MLAVEVWRCICSGGGGDVSFSGGGGDSGGICNGAGRSGDGGDGG